MTMGFSKKMKSEDILTTTTTSLLSIQTEEEVEGDSSHTTKLPHSGGWLASFFIIGTEVVERFAFYGVSSNLITYLTKEMHQSTASSAKIINNWIGFITLVAVLGAFLADVYWGRFRTSIASTLIYLLGLICLTISVSVRKGRPGPDCSDVPCSSEEAGLLPFFISLYMISIGTGGLKPCLQAFGADQFEKENPKERRQLSSFFNWWYFGVCMGSLAAFTVIVYIQDNVGWSVGFGIPMLSMAFGMLLLLVGTPFYRYKLPTGTQFVNVFQVLRGRIWRRSLSLPCEAGLSTQDDSLHGPQKFRPGVEDTKLLWKIVPIWVATLMFGVIIAQVPTLFTRQGSSMKSEIAGTGLTVPPASLQAFSTLVLLTLLPIYDRVFVPLARKRTGIDSGITILQRMGVGMLILTASMAIAALVEAKRLRESSPIAIFWLIPQYLLMGTANVFALVGQQEFFHGQVPGTLQSVGISLYLSSHGVGSFLSSALIEIVDRLSSSGTGQSWFSDDPTKSHLDYFYWLLAGLNLANLCIYIMLARAYTYRHELSSNQAEYDDF